MLGFDPLDKMSLRDAFEFAKEHGLILEIQLEPPLFVPSMDKELKRLRSEYMDVPLIIHAPYKDLSLSSVIMCLREASVRAIIDTIDLAAEIDVSLVVLHAGGRGVLPALELENIRNSLEKIMDHARTRGVLVAVENEPPWKGILRDAGDFLQLDIPICLDVAHAYASGNLDAFLDLLTERVVAYHLSDTLRRRDLHLPLGKGEILWKSVLARLNASKPWILEVGDKEAVLQSLNLIRSLGF